MKYTTWILVGLGIILLSFLGRVLFTRFIKPLPGTAVRLGKAWGKTTDRYFALRALNTFFYIVGMAVTVVGITIGIGAAIRPEPAQAPVVFRPIPDEKLESAQVFQLVNYERKQQNLPLLISDPKLVAVAEARAKDMADNQYYAHINPAGLYFYDLYPDFGFKSEYSCENLDIGFTTNESQYITDWLTSTKGHKECMLNPKTSVAGYAVILFGETPNGKIYLVVGIHSTPLKPL